MRIDFSTKKRKSLQASGMSALAPVSNIGRAPHHQPEAVVMIKCSQSGLVGTFGRAGRDAGDVNVLAHGWDQRGGSQAFVT